MKKKKKKITNLLKFGILFFGISLLLWNCVREPNIETISEIEQKKLNITITSLDHLENDNNKVAKQIEKYFKKEVNSKTISSEYGFYINEERVQIIENEGYTTYTFIVERDSLQEGVLENYMYKEFEDETYKQFLLKYYYTLNDVGERIYSTTVMDIEEIIDESLLINKNPTSGDCFPHFVESYLGFICTTNQTCSGPGADGSHEVGDECECQVNVMTCQRAGIQICQHTYGYTFDDCSGGGTGNDDVTNPNEPDDPQTGGGNTSDPDPNPDPDEDETEAVPFEEIELRRECKKINNFLTNNSDFKLVLLDQSKLNSLHGDVEKSASKFKNVTAITVDTGTPNSPEVRILDATVSANYEAYSHIHYENPNTLGGDTYSVFSLDDLFALATLAKAGKLENNFTTYLATGKGTYFAMTIPNPQKLIDFFLTKFESLPNATNINAFTSYLDAQKKFNKFNDMFFKDKNGIIQKTNMDNDLMLGAFLDFLEQADMGLDLFKTDENFDTFTKVSLDNVQNIDGSYSIKEKPCNN